MRRSLVICPNCDGRNVRLARLLSLRDRLWRFVFSGPFRCFDCYHRFWTGIMVEFHSREIAGKYNRFAAWYDYLETLLGLLGLKKLRKSILAEASGKVLEVAIGTGQNLQHYRSDCDIIGVDISDGMLTIARQQAEKTRFSAQLSLADAEALPFPNDCFDTVVSSLSLCTFPNPTVALQEMARVSKPSSPILLLEHGRSNRRWLGRFQDEQADKFAQPLGCHWNREPLDLIESAGLKVIGTERNFFGVFHRITAVPGRATTPP